MRKIVKYVVLDILSSKIIIAYTLFLLLFSFGLFLMEEVPEKSLASMLTLNLIIVPLISIVFSTIYLYNSNEFIELLSAQPIKRKTLWFSIFLGLSLSLALAFLVGCGLPIFLFAATATGFTMIITGVIISVIFVSLAMLVTVYTKDKARGIGISLLVWFYFALLFDGIVLFVLFQLMDYPLEKLIVGLSILNPIDLARILTLLKMDISALMGATSAVFKQSFEGVIGSLISFTVLILWIVIPLFLSSKKFKKKDL